MKKRIVRRAAKKTEKKVEVTKKKFGIKKLFIFAACLIAVYIAAGIGSLFTSKNVNDVWYLYNKPSITPPNWVFPVVWNILFVLIAISLFIAWTSAKNRKQKWKIGIAFGTNLALNALWSYLFFGLQNPAAGFIDIIALIATIIWMMAVCWKIDRRASYLLVPYLLWVSFASILNFLFIF